MSVITLLLLVLGILTEVQSYPDGAPISACNTGTPAHQGASPGSGSGGHVVGASASTYEPSGAVTVTITGDFAGVLLQARKTTTNEIVGSFINPPVGFKITECSNPADTVTHENGNTTSGFLVTWVAPATDQGGITFVATVADDHDTYWIRQVSDSMSPSGFPVICEMRCAAPGVCVPGFPDTCDCSETNYPDDQHCAGSFIRPGQMVVTLAYFLTLCAMGLTLF